MNNIKKFKTLPELYRFSAEKYTEKESFLSSNKTEFEGITLSHLYEKGLYLATALIHLDIQYKDNVVVLADNRLEWILVHYGISMAGARDVPRGVDITDREMNEIIPHSDAKIVVVENDAMLNKLLGHATAVKGIEKFIIMESDSASLKPNQLTLQSLLSTGKKLYDEGDRKVEERIESLKEDDLATIIYTSGATGNPKGVMLTHANLISQVERVYQVFPLDESDRLLTLLPVWHVFERMLEITCIAGGVPIYYTNVRNLKSDLSRVKPTIFPVAPRLLEKIHSGITSAIRGSSIIKRSLFKIAYSSSAQYKKAYLFLTGKRLRLKKDNLLCLPFDLLFNVLRLLLFFIPKTVFGGLVFKKIIKVTGGNVKLCISGSSALPAHIDDFFYNIDFPILEGYGLTETSPVISVRTLEKVILGCVGNIWPDTSLRLIDINNNHIIYDSTWPQSLRTKAVNLQGEIHVKGPQIMKGYHKNEEQTNKVLKDGWFNTGDLGVMSLNETLKIVGRSKDTIVLLGGENVEPSPIEDALLASSYIEKCMLLGQDKKYLACLIVPSIEGLKSLGDSYHTIINNPSLEQMIQKEINERVNKNSNFKTFERIVSFRILEKEFEVGDELNYVFKLKRNVVLEKYTNLIEEIYS